MAATVNTGTVAARIDLVLRAETIFTIRATFTTPFSSYSVQLRKTSDSSTTTWNLRNSEYSAVPVTREPDWRFA